MILLLIDMILILVNHTQFIYITIPSLQVLFVFVNTCIPNTNYGDTNIAIMNNELIEQINELCRRNRNRISYDDNC